jgi:hypothetical protein
LGVDTRQVEETSISEHGDLMTGRRPIDLLPATHAMSKRMLSMSATQVELPACPCVFQSRTQHRGLSVSSRQVDYSIGQQGPL